MNDARSVSAVSIALAVLAVLLSSVYVGGYFWLAEPGYGTSEYRTRCYQSQWLVTVFKPAAMVESAITGREVFLESDDL